VRGPSSPKRRRTDATVVDETEDNTSSPGRSRHFGRGTRCAGDERNSRREKEFCSDPGRLQSQSSWPPVAGTSSTLGSPSRKSPPPPMAPGSPTPGTSAAASRSGTGRRGRDVPPTLAAVALRCGGRGFLECGHNDGWRRCARSGPGVDVAATHAQWTSFAVPK
jgi:hypothetical protein